MANEVPYAFPVELLSGTHNFASDTFKLALYTSSPYTTASTVYDATNGNNGNRVFSWRKYISRKCSFKMLQNYATVDFTDSVWGSPTPATFSAAFGAIYNSSATNKLIVVLDFGGTKSCSNGTFTVTFPSPTSGTPSGADALLSIKSN